MLGMLLCMISTLDLRSLGGAFPRAATAPLVLCGVCPTDCRLFPSITVMCWSHFLTHLLTCVLNL
jgi:hypothetical protein